MVRDTIFAGAQRLLRALALLLAATLAIAAVPADAQPRVTHAPCLAHPEAGQDYARLLAQRSAWTCDRGEWTANRDRAVLRFDLAEGRVPDRLTTRLARFTSARIGIVRPDSSIAWHKLTTGSFSPYGHMTIATPLPDAGTPARAVLFEVVRPTINSLLTLAELSQGSRDTFHSEELVLAVLCGLLMTPLLFNLAFYRVLRERFLLWHALVASCMLGQIVVTSGLARYLGDLPVDVISYLVITTFCGGTAAAVMLAKTFIEPDKLDPVHRRALLLAAVWIMFSCSVFVTWVDQLQQTAIQLYYIGWLPVVAVLVWVMVVAARRGSRAIWYQIAAWTPLMVTSIARMGTNTFGPAEPTLLFRLQDLSIAIEVIVISMGIIDRLVSLRRDLDRQLRRTTTLERLAERDPLTGLMNRRAIEPNFARLRADGFATFAVLDLDRFKDINDRFGHSVGDKVLQATARALPPSDDMLSMRLGGEEFVLLLRGSNAVRHAEWCRQALSNRIAAEVEGLDRIVTASMGLVEIPEDVMPDASFALIYARADGLLYQAKRSGRNRTVKERLSSFGKSPHQRRKTDVAAA